MVGAVVQGRARREVLACRDESSLWVEVSAPGGPWQMTPGVARELADHLTRAADAAETEDGGVPGLRFNRRLKRCIDPCYDGQFTLFRYDRIGDEVYPVVRTRVPREEAEAWLRGDDLRVRS